MVNLIKISKQTYINPDKIISVFKEVDTDGKTVWLSIDLEHENLTFNDIDAIAFAENALGIRRVFFEKKEQPKIDKHYQINYSFADGGSGCRFYQEADVYEAIKAFLQEHENNSTITLSVKEVE